MCEEWITSVEEKANVNVSQETTIRKEPLNTNRDICSWFGKYYLLVILKDHSDRSTSVVFFQRQDNEDEDEPKTAERVKEDKWHYKLREEFINYYTQFLQSQQFALVQLATQPKKV